MYLLKINQHSLIQSLLLKRRNTVVLQDDIKIIGYLTLDSYWRIRHKLIIHIAALPVIVQDLYGPGQQGMAEALI